MPSPTPLFIRLFRLSFVIDREMVRLNNKMQGAGFNMAKQRRYDSLAKRKQILEHHKQKIE